MGIWYGMHQDLSTHLTRRKEQPQTNPDHRSVLEMINIMIKY